MGKKAKIVVVVFFAIVVAGIFAVRWHIIVSNQRVLDAEFVPQYKQLIEERGVLAEMMKTIYPLAKNDMESGEREFLKYRSLLREHVRKHKELLSDKYPYASMIRFKDRKWYQFHINYINNMEEYVSLLDAWESRDTKDLDLLFDLLTKHPLHPHSSH
jgi:hypothetical protein